MLELNQKEITLVSGSVTAKEVLKETAKVIAKGALVVAILGAGFCIGCIRGLIITNNINPSSILGKIKLMQALKRLFKKKSEV